MANLRNLQFRDRLNYGLLAIAVMLILTTSMISVQSIKSLRNSIEQVQTARVMKETFSEFQILSGVDEAIWLRFLISGSPEFLAEGNAQSRKLDEMLKRMVAMAQANQTESMLVQRLLGLHALRVARFREVTDLKFADIRAGTNTRVPAKMADGKGVKIVKAQREVLLQMIGEQDRRLLKLTEESDRLVKQANATVLSANGLALVAGILGFIALRRAQRESERSLRNEVKALQANRASEEKSAFLANMSHEIRTPMNAIFGFAQLLSESVKAPVERDWVQSIKKSGQMLLTLINNVLDLSKIEAGKFQLNPQPTDLEHTLQETIDMFSTLAADKGIALGYEVEAAGNICNLEIDAQRLRQVLMNLISNALKYTDAGSVLVTMYLSPSRNEQLRNLRISVADTGVGIADDQRIKIFEPFHQAESPDGKVRQGTGLGLSITRRLLDMMGGRISVESELGKGSTFIVDIPQLRVSTTALSPAALDDQPVNFNRLRPLKILIVDDMVWNAQVAQGYLGKSHHSVYIANDGVEGVSLAKSLRPDVVLMDLRMPRMNGYEARDSIRAEATLLGTSIIAVTASSLGGEEQRLRAIFDGYIRKPFAPMDLFVALEAIFGAQKQELPAAEVLHDLTQPPANVSAQMQIRWQRLHGVKLDSLRRTMRMREIAAFALDMQTLADELHWPKLAAHAAKLDVAVRRFDIFAVKQLLNDLVDWPKDLSDAP